VLFIVRLGSMVHHCSPGGATGPGKHSEWSHVQSSFWPNWNHSEWNDLEKLLAQTGITQNGKTQNGKT
jgi:hypothetical protein